MSISFLGASTVSVIDHGAVGDGLSIEDSAFESAIDELISRGGGTLWVPSGTYKISKRLDINVLNSEHISIRGLGKNVSRLEYIHGTGSPPPYGGILFNSTSTVLYEKPTFEIKDIGLFANVDNIGTAIESKWVDDENVDSALNVTSVYARQGQVLPPSNGFWTRGIDTTHARNSTIDDFYFIGEYKRAVKTKEAIRLKGQSTAVNIHNNTILGADVAVLAQDVCEGINIHQCNFVGVRYGVRHNIASGAEPQLSVANSHINATDVCVWSKNVQQGGIINNLLYAFSGYGYVNPWWGVIIEGSNSRSMKVIGNSFEKDGGHNGKTTHGVHVTGGDDYCFVSNQFRGRSNSHMTYGIVGSSPIMAKSANTAVHVTNPGI